MECKSCLLIWVGWFEIEKSIAYLFNSFSPRPMCQEGKRWRRCRTTPTTLSTPSWSSPCRSATCHYYRTRKCAKKKFQVSCLEQPDEAFIRALNIHDWFICFCFTTPFSISDATKTYPTLCVALSYLPGMLGQQIGFIKVSSSLLLNHCLLEAWSEMGVVLLLGIKYQISVFRFIKCVRLKWRLT